MCGSVILFLYMNLCRGGEICSEFKYCWRFVQNIRMGGLLNAHTCFWYVHKLRFDELCRMCDTGVHFTGTPFFVLVHNMTSLILKIHYSHISCACLPVKPNGIIITEELREELHQAALATTQAYVGARSASAGNN